MTNLLTGELSELDILDQLIEAGVIEESDKEYKRQTHDNLKKLVSIRDFQFPVEIVREEDLEVVTEIFIRVNSAGTRLR